jgi:uncharacterized Zn-finger protein
MSEPSIYVCNIEYCQKKFKNQRNLKLHKKHHILERPHVCDVEDCQKKFRDATDLIRHKKSHSDERPDVSDFEVKRVSL